VFFRHPALPLARGGAPLGYYEATYGRHVRRSTALEHVFKQPALQGRFENTTIVVVGT
jgi:hypothetical protein